MLSRVKVTAVSRRAYLKLARLRSPTAGLVAPNAFPPAPKPRGHAVRDDEEGMVMRYLDEIDETPTKFVRLIGDLCGILIYTGIVGLLVYAVLR